MREELAERGARILTKLLSRPAVKVTRVAGFFKQPYLRAPWRFAAFLPRRARFISAAFMGPRLQSCTWERT